MPGCVQEQNVAIVMYDVGKMLPGIVRIVGEPESSQMVVGKPSASPLM